MVNAYARIDVAMPKGWYVVKLDRDADEEPLGPMLRRLREEKSAKEGEKWTQRKVAEALGIEQNVLSKYERGEISRPRNASLRLFADFYGVGMDDLILASNRETPEIPANSYIVPGHPVLIRHLKLLNAMESVEEVEELSRTMAARLGLADVLSLEEERRSRKGEAG